MRRASLALVLCFSFALSSCGLIEPTYVDVPADIAAGIDLENENMEDVKARLTEKLGLPITNVYKEGEVLVAEVKPAVEEVTEDVSAVVAANPANPREWVVGGIGGAMTLLLALSGFRGRSTRTKEENA